MLGNLYLVDCWVAVKELKLNFYNKEIQESIVCPYYGNLNPKPYIPMLW